MISGIRYKSLKRFTFVDIEDVEVGSIEGLVLENGTLKPTHLLLGAGFFEEFMEAVGNKDDIDELAEIEIMEELDDSVILIKKKISELIHTDHDGVLPFEATLFSDLEKSEVLLQGQEVEADLQDYELDGDRSTLVFQFPKLHEEASQLGFMQRFDVLILINRLSFDKNVINIEVSITDMLDKIQKEITPKMNGKSFIRLE